MYKIFIAFIFISFFVEGQNTPCPPWPLSKPQKGGVFNTPTKDSLQKKSEILVPEENVMFAKQVWSYIDFKEDLNKKLCNNSNIKQKIYPLYEILNLWITLGKIRCFRYSNFGSTKNIPVTMIEFKKLCIKRDSIDERVINENGEEKIIKSIKADTLTSSNILGFVVKEDWFFNKRSVLMEKKVIGFAPVYFDTKTQKQKELYWVYYPECCELLSSYQTFNPNGVSETFTFRDLFEKRSFSSYVLKESNVYGRDKPENSKGIEVETENKKNKEKLESYEEDLWEK